MSDTPVPMLPQSGQDTHDDAVQRTRRSWPDLSSILDRIEARLGSAGFDRAPWLAVGFAAGIGLWFLLGSPWQWVAGIAALILIAIASASLWRGANSRQALNAAIVSFSLVCAAGLATIWMRSELVGTEAIERPQVMALDARILAREEQPAQNRVRLTLAARDAAQGRAIKVRVNVPEAKDAAGFEEGARIRLRARLMPPAAPMLPGAYDFARTAWFQGLAATGSVIGDIELIEASDRPDWLAETQRKLSAHVLTRIDGSPGSIAAAFASGDRGAISEADEIAMRDAGLTHLLSISGLHVSAVIAAGYFLAAKLLALWPWLTLRVRLPIVAAGVAAAAGIGYTLLTGAEVPTVRSCVAAILVLIALALGREPLSLRMVAVAAIVVMLLWPEALAGPSFQMSFAAVITIIAFHASAPIRIFLAPREESWWSKAGRRVLVLFATGAVIEIALTPIVLYHFHRSGIYGAFANVLAIPLVTFASMPLIAVALLFDLVGLGAPFWWLADKSLELLVAIAHFTAERPGAVRLFPQMGLATIFLFVGGFLWMALWRGRGRLWGLVPAAVATGLLLITPVPDVFVSRDGRHVGIAGEDERLLVLREGRSSYARDNLVELSATRGTPVVLSEWPGARCSDDFCVVDLEREGRNWSLLISRSQNRVEERALAAACAQADIVVSDRYLPRSCTPRWLKADRRYLDRSGGLAINLSEGEIDTVASRQGEHGWWRGSARE